jgi:serine/threonine-protein kinase
MAKVFTITEGLENMGALKTGGQGSVYKGKRIGEIITAIKIIPTPIYSESEDDKNFTSFQNEVNKLKKVNEQPNPNVVTIINSGITESGNFPFIEMEYIEGPDLEELLKPPDDPVFTIKETIKVAEQLSNALAHCHKVDVKHGDIKSNNVKFNTRSGNYILLDFGLSVMSDEQRRTSLRHAGAIEFMAPEQSEGQMLFQSDIYSFGVIIFELLAGTVPFPLKDGGETARNKVMLAHLETQPPDLLSLRQKALPEFLSDEKKAHQMHVPQWLVTMVYKCLEKKPEHRFKNGIELNEYIILNSTLTSKKVEANVEQPGWSKGEKEILLSEKELLHQQLLQYQHLAGVREKEIEELKALVKHKNNEVQLLIQGSGPYAKSNTGTQRGVSKTAFITLLVLTIGLATFAGYTLYNNKEAGTKQTSSVQNKKDSLLDKDTSVKQTEMPVKKKNEQADIPQERKTQPPIFKTDEPVDAADTSIEQTEISPTQDDLEETADASKEYGKYKVTSIAYFHDEPDENTRRNAFIIHWNNAVLTALNELNGFVYVSFTNHLGQTSKGWLLKSDLKRIEE